MVVLALEAVNTAIEYAIDLISPEQHPLAGKAKDMAAAAVLIAAIGTVIIAGIIFGTRVWGWGEEYLFLVWTSNEHNFKLDNLTLQFLKFNFKELEL